MLPQRDPIEQAIIETQKKLDEEIIKEFPKLREYSDPPVKFEKEHGLIKQIPNVDVSSEDMSVNIAEATQKKIEKYNFLEKIQHLRNQQKLTRLELNALLKEYPSATSGAFSRVKKIVKALEKEIIAREEPVKGKKKDSRPIELK